MRQLAARSEYRIYTPGSEAGLPLSILQSFNAPRGPMLEEDRNQKIDAIASALLGLTGISADPVQSKEHVFIAALLAHAWGNGEDLDLPKLIKRIQEPPMSTIGALELDDFYKKKDRMKLAVSLNNILASPSFSTWLRGDPLDLGQLLNKPKAQQLIFSVAHLDDAQRMFFITLLLAEVLAWTRKQSGTTSLRAILYFDEVFGYLPPHPGNPPSKQPLMTLLKQARAFGVGVLLATQNPVDIDYKALSNTGTWFVGKLQTERDKARLLDGLEGAAAERGARSDRAELERTIASLSNRVFLLHNIHRGGAAAVFQTRYALSFLRGPMTRDEINRLMDPVKRGLPAQAVAPGETGSAPPPSAPSAPAQPSAPAPTTPPAPQATAPPTPTTPVTPPAITQPVSGPPATTGVARFFLPVRLPAPPGATLRYEARLFGRGEVTGEDKKMGRTYQRVLCLLAQPPADGQAADWAKAERVPEGFDPQPRSDAAWGDVPASLSAPAKLPPQEQSFSAYLAAFKPSVPTCQKLNMSCRPDEKDEDFRARCRVEAWKEFLKELAAEKETYSGEFARYQATVPAAPAPADGTPWEELWKPYLPGSPALRCTSSPSLTQKQKEELERMEVDWHKETIRVAEKWKKIGEQLVDSPLTVKKGSAKVREVGLAWVPFWVVPGSEPLPAYRG